MLHILCVQFGNTALDDAKANGKSDVVHYLTDQVCALPNILAPMLEGASPAHHHILMRELFIPHI